MFSDTFAHYHKFNAITRIDAQPTLRIDETLDALVGMRWFSTLDDASRYLQVKVAESDSEKMALLTTVYCTNSGFAL
ncbi:hypothetical protein T06_7219 [Trichinella sp. T6]|nr:hypothetical protein T06_7219 [Trichinella sp. T6]